QLMDHIRKTVTGANIIYINMEMEDFIHIKSNIELNAYLEDKWINGQPNYLFIDEVQEVSSFERTLRSLLAKCTCDIYCTGSNANMLSGELRSEEHTSELQSRENL